MKPLIHILGSDIPHHNQTILNFFENELTQQLPVHRVSQFMMVASGENYSEQALKKHFPNLQIQVYSSKKSLSEALIQRAQDELDAEFFLHGQFNGPIWIALLSGKLSGSRISWHIWGADLYEDAKGWKFKLYYLMRRFAQKKVSKVFATEGDRKYFSERNPLVQTQRLYFPTKMNHELTPSIEQKLKRSERLLEEKKPIILLGNSGDKSNQHLRGLALIKQLFPAGAHIIIPLGYPANNEHYIAEIKRDAYQLFDKNDVTLLTSRLDFNEYLKLLERCDLACFLFERQQGIGTISLCMQFGVPFMLSRKNPFTVDLSNENIPYLLDDQTISIEQLANAQQSLSELDIHSVGFLAPNYLTDWHRALSEN